MSMPSLVQLGTCLSRVSTWNPLRASANEVFRYIDLSSVNQDTKSISDAREVACGEAPSRARQLVTAGDVVVSTVRPNLNGVARVPSELEGATASTGFCVLRPEPKKIDGDYLFQWVKSSVFIGDMVSKATGASYPAVSDRIIFESSIPLPPLEEQRRIAAILDQAETLRTQRRAALAQLDSLTQSLFLDMFGDSAANPKGWPTCELQDVVKPGAIVTYGIVQAGDEFPGGVPYIRTGDLVNGSIRLTELRHTDPELAVKFSRSRVETNEIVMSIRATVGTTALVPVELDGANLTQGTARIAPGENMHFYYLLYFLRSDSTQHWIDRQVKGATFREITLGRLRELPVLVPPLAVQQTFATRIQAIEALKATHRAALAELDALFASLQQRAFSGELSRPASEAVATHTKRDLSAMCLLDAKKMLEALIYVAKRMPEHNFYKSLKALYSGDRQHLENHGSLIYGETYEAMEHGPVPKAAYALTKTLEEAASSNLFADDPTSIPLQRTGNQLIPARDADFGLLSAAERNSLDWAIKYYAPMSFAETKTVSHDSAYLATVLNAPMAIEVIIRSLPEVAQRRFFG